LKDTSHGGRAAERKGGAEVVGPDQGPNGTGVGQRLILEEPMLIILNMGILCEFLVFFFFARCADVRGREFGDDRFDDDGVPRGDVGGLCEGVSEAGFDGYGV
jgi:hypothetical protein